VGIRLCADGIWGHYRDSGNVGVGLEFGHAGYVGHDAGKKRV
jgi:hypothetical protein